MVAGRRFTLQELRNSLCILFFHFELVLMYDYVKHITFGICEVMKSPHHTYGLRSKRSEREAI